MLCELANGLLLTATATGRVGTVVTMKVWRSQVEQTVQQAQSATSAVCEM